VYFNAPDPSQAYGYNPLKRVVKDKRPLAASGLLEVMKKMWDDAWGPRMEHILLETSPESKDLRGIERRS
jgi:hypothetical protein